MSGAPRVTYWAGLGRCEPLRCIIAAGGDKAENVFMSKKSDIQALRSEGKLAYGQVPLVEVDGLCLVQGYATAQYLGSKYGLYPTDPKEQYIVGHVFAACSDARGPLLGAPFRGDNGASGIAECQGPTGLFGRYVPAWEAMLGSGGCFFLGSKPSIADVAVFEVLDAYKFWAGDKALTDALAPFPKVQASYAGTLSLGRLQEWCEVERPSVFLPQAQYVQSVKATLY